MNAEQFFKEVNRQRGPSCAHLIPGIVSHWLHSAVLPEMVNLLNFGYESYPVVITADETDVFRLSGIPVTPYTLYEELIKLGFNVSLVQEHGKHKVCVYPYI